MKEEIIEIALEKFLLYGFKSVTMDDIANSLGISKKTLYTYFNNKTELVTSVTDHIFTVISSGIDMICKEKKNPIQELFDVKRFVMENLKDEKSSPVFQLQKYYPQIHACLKEKQFCIVQETTQENLKRGIEMGLYRKEIDIDFIARIYFNGMACIKDKEMFPLKKYSMNTLMDFYLDYHLRGICTKEGIKELETQLHLHI